MDWDYRQDALNAARVTIADGVMTYGTRDTGNTREAARSFADTYDFNLEPEDDPADVWIVCDASNLRSGRNVVFAFNAAGSFEYPTQREYRTR